MRYSGDAFEAGKDYNVSDVVLTDNSLSLDWVEDGRRAHLQATSTDGTCFEGSFGYPRPDSSRTMKLDLFQGPGGRLIFYGNWKDRSEGYEGKWVVHLTKLDD